MSRCLREVWRSEKRSVVVERLDSRKNVAVEVVELEGNKVLIIPEECIRDVGIGVGNRFIFGWRPGNKNTVRAAYETRGKNIY
jgi:hypothetical protein